MRTTLTLDEDIAAKLKSEARRSGRSFKETVNEALRRALAPPPPARKKAPFRVVARDLGRLRAGIALDNISELLEHSEGLQHR